MHTGLTFYWFGFVAAFLATAVWETFQPKRELSVPASRRWGMHSLMWLICIGFSVVVLRASPLMLALNSPFESWGLLNLVRAPFIVKVLAAILFFDLVKYSVHRLFHSIGVFWRVHQVHHSDPDFDVSTAARFHPIEVLVNQCALMSTVVLLGLPAPGVLAAELLGNAFSFFEHANASLPAWIEWPLRRVLVTPDMHRTHHSDEIADQSSNFGQIFSWWDVLFKTYSKEPRRGTSEFNIGLPGYQNARSLELGFMISVPFVGDLDRAPARQGRNR